MSLGEVAQALSEDTEGAGQGDESKLVPVAESIRYRKRAQSAEKRVDVLTEQLAEARNQAAEMSERLATMETEQELARQLVSAGAVDVEAAVLLAKARMEGDGSEDLADVIDSLRKEKQYLFDGVSRVPRSRKTASARERIRDNQAAIEKAAQTAATSGSRRDLQEYLKLRRNFL